MDLPISPSLTARRPESCLPGRQGHHRSLGSVQAMLCPCWAGSVTHPPREPLLRVPATCWTLGWERGPWWPRPSHCPELVLNPGGREVLWGERRDFFPRPLLPPGALSSQVSLGPRTVPAPLLLWPRGAEALLLPVPGRGCHHGPSCPTPAHRDALPWHRGLHTTQGRRLE